MATLCIDIGLVKWPHRERMSDGMGFGKLASSRIKALALPGWAWSHPSWEEWCRTLEAVASSIDPKGSLEYAAACAKAWGSQVRASNSSYR